LPALLTVRRNRLKIEDCFEQYNLLPFTWEVVDYSTDTSRIITPAEAVKRTQELLEVGLWFITSYTAMSLALAHLPTSLHEFATFADVMNQLDGLLNA
jgi:hypothetical protein